MRNVHEVLRQKEMDLERVRSEVEALRFVVPLLAERTDPLARHSEPVWLSSPQNNRWPLRIGEPVETQLDS